MSVTMRVVSTPAEAVVDASAGRRTALFELLGLSAATLVTAVYRRRQS